ncbi:MAG: SPOR domain-containing protein [Hyphomicrobiales bacterium]
MDQDSSNGASDRRNWRERLGIAKEPAKASGQALPKLSDDFKPEPAPAKAEPRLSAPAAAKPSAPSQGTPVKPAPMAPRPSQAGQARPAPAPVATRPAAPASRPPAAQASRGAPAATAKPAASTPAKPAATTSAPAVPASTPASDEFAERLKKQREAAERLAQQRAQSRIPQQPAAPSPQPATPAAAPQAGGPRFTFAPEELEQGPPLAAAPSVAQPVSRPQGAWAPGYPPLPGPPLPGAAPLPQGQASPYQRPTAYPYGQPYNAQARYGAAARPMAPQTYQPPEGWGNADAQGRPISRPQVPRQDAPYAPAYQPPEPPEAREPAEEEGGDVPYPEHLRPALRPRPQVGAAPRRMPASAPAAEDDVFVADDPRRRQPATRGRVRGELAPPPQRTYADYDEEFDDERPARRGPLLVLLGLLLVAILAGLLLWLYSQNGHRLGAASGGQTSDIPVIAPPQQPVKATPEPAPAASAPAAAQTQGRKQIYDRILGEDAVDGSKVVPTEEQPVPPAATPPAAGTGTDAQPPAAEPPPPAGQQGGVSQPEPLPLPPPPGQSGQSGSADPSPGAAPVQAAAAPATQGSDQSGGEQIVPSSSAPAQTASADSGQQPSQSLAQEEQSTTSEQTPPPAPAKKKKVAQQPKPESEAIVSSDTATDAAPPQPAPGAQVAVNDPTAPAANQPLPLPAQPQAAQPAPQQQGGIAGLINQITGGAAGSAATAAGTTGQSATRRTNLRDADPLEGSRAPLNGTATATAPAAAGQQVALNLPPAPVTDPTAPATASVPQQAPAAVQPAPAPQVAPAQPAAPATSTGSFFQSLKKTITGTGPSAPATVVTGNQQVAAVAPQATAPAAAPQAATVPAGQGFQVQLSVFSSEAEATTEFQRLKARHPGLLGNLQPRIQQADLGVGGMRYRLGVAPLASRQAANKLCDSLIAAGQRDCTVRPL